jgi:CTP:molybdopterin cytidylyltransferase MocA
VAREPEMDALQGGIMDPGAPRQVWPGVVPLGWNGRAAEQTLIPVGQAPPVASDQVDVAETDPLDRSLVHPRIVGRGGQNERVTIAAVILAAGASTRFGAPKAAVRIGSRTMLQVVVDTATAAGFSPVIVVAPSTIEAAESAEVVRNDTPELGMSRSLRQGLAAVPSDAEAAIVLLADQPTVDVEHLRSLDGWRGGSPVVATRSGGVLGPPVLIEREGFALVDAIVGDTGLRDLLRADPSLVTPVDHPSVPDVDTVEDLEQITEPCPGCGARYLPQVLDETHPYIGASPACWATFGEVLAREFGDTTFGRVHRHTVDVYAIQHSGTDDRRQRQSVALHLIGVCHWLEHGIEVHRLNGITQRLASEDRPWPWLMPPKGYAMTVVDLVGARDGAEHVRLVRRWAETTWNAWAAHHGVVRAWAADALLDRG